MIRFQITNAAEAKAAIARVGARAGEVLTDSMNQAVLILQRGVKTDQLSGNPLKVRSGRLRSSISAFTARTATGVEGTVGTNVPYARIHEYGGEITPKKGQYLTIPLAAALTGAGVLRKPARDWPDTFVMRSKAGNLLIMQKRKGDDMIPLFVLKKRVNISEKRMFRSAVENNSDRIKNLFVRNLKKEIQGKAQ